MPSAPQASFESMTSIRAPDARELGRGLPRRLDRARDPARDVDRDDVAPVAHERLVDGQEVADRGLRGGRQRVGRAQGVVERGEVDDVRLALGALAVVDVEADLADAELGDGLARQVVGGVGDHRDVRHPGHPR